MLHSETRCTLVSLAPLKPHWSERSLLVPQPDIPGREDSWVTTMYRSARVRIDSILSLFAIPRPHPSAARDKMLTKPRAPHLQISSTDKKCQKKLATSSGTELRENSRYSSFELGPRSRLYCRQTPSTVNHTTGDASLHRPPPHTLQKARTCP